MALHKIRDIKSRYLLGISLLELVVSISIIAILAALLYPVLSSSRTSALESRSISNMHQFALAVQIYRNGQDEGGPWHGFPNTPSALNSAKLISEEMFNTEGVPFSGSKYASYFWLVDSNPEDTPNDKSTWWRDWRINGDDTIFLVDISFFNDPDTMLDPLFSHFAIGETLSGTCIKKRGTGDFASDTFWGEANSPNEENQ